MQYRITLTAGVAKRQLFTGRTLVLLDTGAAASLDLSIDVQGFPTEELRAVKRGLKFRGPDFTGATFTAAVDCTIEVIVTAADVSVNYQEGATVNANIQGTVPVQVTGQPISVAATRGDAPANPLHVSGQVLGDTPAANVTDNAAVAAGPVAAALLAADATRLEAVFFNLGPDPVALGMLGITWAKRAIVLNAGDAWVESRAASKAWYVITDAAKAASVTVQERKS